jgi:hypothetical protein
MAGEQSPAIVFPRTPDGDAHILHGKGVFGIAKKAQPIATQAATTTPIIETIIALALTAPRRTALA